MTTTAVSMDSNAGAIQASGRNSMALDGQDFMKIMITELTNQDPFEPMKNQELLNQMATIQQLQSSQEMSKSFGLLMERYDNVLMGQELTTASGMIGQLISGDTIAGQYALGKVVAVNRDGDNILLELDTGQQININDMIRLGGSNSQDIVGKMAIGMTAAGEKVVGKIVSVEVNGSGVTLHLQRAGSPADATVAVPLRSSSIINEDTADLLIGYSVAGLGGIEGVVESVKWTAEKVILNIRDAADKINELPLENLININ